MSEKLTFFISGKEDELENERAVAIQTITDMGFNCTSSENSINTILEVHNPIQDDELVQ